MKNSILIVTLVLASNALWAQNLISISGVFPISGGSAIDIGYHQIRQPRKLGFASIYFGQGSNAVRTKGQLEQGISREERQDEIRTEGKNYNWRGITAGMNLNRYLSVGVSLGQRSTFWTQQRKDPFQTLGANGDYFTQYRVSNRLDVGLLSYGYWKVYRAWHLLGGVQLSTQRGLAFQVGLGIRAY